MFECLQISMFYPRGFLLVENTYEISIETKGFLQDSNKKQ